MSDLPELPDLSGAIVCYTKCWSCMFGHHEKAWHTWADEEDVEHAKSTGQPDPSTRQCGCYCQHSDAD